MAFLDRLATAIMLASGLRRAAIAVLAGAVAVLALQPFGIIAAPFLAFPVLVLLIDGASGTPGTFILRRLMPAFGIGWCFGLGYFVAGLWWLGSALLVEAEAFAWALPLAVLGLPALLALFFGLAAALARAIWSDGAGRIAALAVGFMVAEWLRATVLTGFPWNAVGQMLAPVPLLMQTIGAIGPDGLNLVTVFIVSAPALLLTRRGAIPGLGLAALLLAAHAGYGAWALSRPLPAVADADKPLVRIVQPDIDQSRKLEDKDRSAIFEEHLALSTRRETPADRKPQIIVWPETSIPFILTRSPDALMRIADVLDDDQILLAGAVRAEDPGGGLPVRYYNSIYMIDGRGQILGAYDKVHLVPFGEYLPLADWFKAAGIDPVAMPGGFSATAERTRLVTPSGLVIEPLICYEVIFPNFVDLQKDDASVILNVTNDGWFGQTPGPWQHFAQARLAAILTGIPIVRAANNGISAMIGPRGEVEKVLDFGTKGYLLDVLISSSGEPPVEFETRKIAFWLLSAFFVFVSVSARLSFRRRGN